MNNHQPTDGIYTMHGLAELLQDPNVDPRQLIAHLLSNMDAVNVMQQQMNSLQAQVQEQAHQASQSQAPARTEDVSNTLHALAAHSLEQQQHQLALTESVARLIDRLEQQRHPSRSLNGPAPLSPKFKGEEDFPLEEFEAKLHAAFDRFKNSIISDSDKVNYAFSSMEGPPAQFFAPVFNGRAPDDDGILESYPQFLSVLDSIYGDQLSLDEINYKLGRLRQHTLTMAEYISKFRNLSARAGWNEAANLARFKDGLSDEVKSLLAPQWHVLRTLHDAQAAASSAYQNLNLQQRLRPRTNPGRSAPAHPVQRHKPSPAAASPATSSAMDLDAMRFKKLTSDEKQRRREAGLCMYCGGNNHFAASCPKKVAQLAIVSSSDPENDMA
jgi:hypothetical protein